MLDTKTRSMVAERLSAIEAPVRITMFTQEPECVHCREARELVEDVCSLSDRVDLRVLDFVEDGKEAERLKVDKIPATLVHGDREYGVRFFGVPSGYELDALLDAILSVSRGRVEFPEEVFEVLEKLREPVHIQVFTAPTCPMCPEMVKLAHRLAVASEHITSDMIDVLEFPYYLQRYSILGVPKTVINEKLEFVGIVDVLDVVKKMGEQ